jgi:hypothetical protein
MIDSGTFPACLRKANYFYAPSFPNPTPDPSADPPIVADLPIISVLGYYVVGAGSGSFTIASSGSVTFNVPLTPPDTFKVGWPVIAYGGSTFGPTAQWVLARITDVNTSANTLTLDVYDSKGSGTYADWYIVPQFAAGAWNYIQNENYSAYDTPVRWSTNGGSIGINFPSNATSTNYVTINTPTHKVGYTEINFKMSISVVESEYEYHRPYVGKTLNAKRTLTTTVRSYAYPGPEVVTTSSVDISQTYAFGDGDFSTLHPGYVAGDPAVYDSATGYIVSYPTPSSCTTQNLSASDSTYNSYEYDDTYSTLEPGGPLVLTAYVRTSRAFTSDVTYSTPSPTSFFWPG